MKRIFKSRIKETIIVFTITGLIIIGALTIRQFFPYEYKINIFGYLMLILSGFHIFVFIFTKRTNNILFALIAGSLSYSYFTDYKGKTFTIPFIVMLCIGLYFQYLNTRFLANYYQILRLAATRINSIEDGFTNRPLPVGNHNSTKPELIKFAKFLKRECIANYLEVESGIYLILTGWHVLKIKDSKISKQSYLFFNNSGEISVNIIRKDYDQYENQFTFHELCKTIGEIYGEFLEFYKNNESIKIVKIINSKIGVEK